METIQNGDIEFSVQLSHFKSGGAGVAFSVLIIDTQEPRRFSIANIGSYFNPLTQVFSKGPSTFEGGYAQSPSDNPVGAIRESFADSSLLESKRKIVFTKRGTSVFVGQTLGEMVPPESSHEISHEPFKLSFYTAKLVLRFANYGPEPVSSESKITIHSATIGKIRCVYN